MSPLNNVLEFLKNWHRRNGRTGNLAPTIQYQGTQKHQMKIACILAPSSRSDL